MALPNNASTAVIISSQYTLLIHNCISGSTPSVSWWNLHSLVLGSLWVIPRFDWCSEEANGSWEVPKWAGGKANKAISTFSDIICRERERGRGEKKHVYFELALFLLFFYDSTATVRLSAALCWGMSLFCVSAKWSIKWGERSVSESAAWHHTLLNSCLFYLNFLSNALIVPSVHHSVGIRAADRLQKERAYVLSSYCSQLSNDTERDTTTLTDYTHPSFYSPSSTPNMQQSSL